MTRSEAAGDRMRDGDAEVSSPTRIPARRIPAREWREVLRSALRKAKKDNLTLLAGGVAFFAFLALFPALITLVTLVGLLADPGQITTQVHSFTVGLPQASQELISDQLITITRSGGGVLTIALVVSLLAELWAASSGTSNLMRAVNLAYDIQESRGYLQLRGVALLLTLGAIVFLVLTLTLIAFVPVVLAAAPLGTVDPVLAQVLRWPLLLTLVLVGLAVLYRMAPDRRAPRFRWVTPGSVAAALLWLLGSLGFSLYVDFFSDYNKTYGALAGVIVLMLWLWLTSYLVLLGAEINFEVGSRTPRSRQQASPSPT